VGEQSPPLLLTQTSWGNPEVLADAALALEYGFRDVDGRQPSPLTVNEE
jgi:hypothetical protein